MRAGDTKERTERRLLEMRDHQKKVRECEMEERKQMRLEEMREYQREVRGSEMEESTETDEARRNERAPERSEGRQMRLEEMRQQHQREVQRECEILILNNWLYQNIPHAMKLIQANHHQLNVSAVGETSTKALPRAQN